MKITLKRLSGIIHDTAEVMILLDGITLQGSGESLRACLNDYALNAEVIGLEAGDDLLKIYLVEDDEGSGKE